MGDFFQQLEGMGVSPRTTVEVGVLSDIIEDVLHKCPNEQGLYIFGQMLARLFYDEVKMGDHKSHRDAMMGLSYAQMDHSYFYDSRPREIETLRRRSKKDEYGFAFKDKPAKQKPLVLTVDIVTTDDETIYILTNPDGKVDEYTKFTNLEKYVSLNNATIIWLGDDDSRPLSLLWNEEDDPDNE